MNTSAGVATLGSIPSSSMSGQQTIETEAGADAGQFLRRVQFGQVVVPPAGADAAAVRAVRREKFRRSCRCSSPSPRAIATSSCRRLSGTPAAFTAASNSASRATPVSPRSLPATSGASFRKISSLEARLSCRQFSELQHISRLLVGCAGRCAISAATLSGPILCSLSSARSTVAE